MSNEACQALREIESGRLKISDFAPPEVFSSGLFSQYPLTVADLRWHLTECDECGCSMAVARDQVEAFDSDRTAAISAALDSVEEALTCRIAWLRQESQSMAEDIAAEFGSEYEEPTLRADLVEDWSRNILLENLDRYYLAAIRAHAFLGKAIWGWLATLVRPALPRVLVSRGGDIIDVGVSNDEIVAVMRSAPHLAAILAADTKLAHLLLRSLLLRQAFGGLVPDVSEQADVAALLSDATPELPVRGRTAIDWRKVWEHYTAFAETQAERVCAVPGIAEPTELQISISEQLEAHRKWFQESLGKGLETIGETVRDGQAAMMDSLGRQEAVHRELLEAYRKLPSAIQDRCRDTVELALGDLFGQLADKSRACLLTGEWIYSESPPNLEFSGAIVEFTKAFEEEVRRSMAPLDKRLQELIASDHNWKGPRRTSILQLGHWVHLLEDHKPELESEMARLGLDYQLFADAIRQVNEYKGAKHTEVKSKADATSLHSLFLGRPPSVLAAVVRKAN